MLFLPPGEHERGHLRRHLHTSPHPDLTATLIPRSTLPQTRQAPKDCEVVAMTQLLTSPATTSSQLAPVYQSDLARTIGVLQQLQALCATQSDDTSLADVIG